MFCCCFVCLFVFTSKDIPQQICVTLHDEITNEDGNDNPHHDDTAISHIKLICLTEPLPAKLPMILIITMMKLSLSLQSTRNNIDSTKTPPPPPTTTTRQHHQKIDIMKIVRELIMLVNNVESEAGIDLSDNTNRNEMPESSVIRVLADMKRDLFVEVDFDKMKM